MKSYNTIFTDFIQYLGMRTKFQSMSTYGNKDSDLFDR
jgi:hypothetical protein